MLGGRHRRGCGNVAGEVMAMRQQDILGRLGERAAGEYPERAGCRIHDRKYRCAGGETGIVAVGRRVLMPCGVKTRPDVRYATPVDAVTSQKLRKLGGSAVRTLSVDIVGVFGFLSCGFGLEHVRVVG
jgi:Holliday junction resolvase-like predicted endonuclease